MLSDDITTFKIDDTKTWEQRKQVGKHDVVVSHGLIYIDGRELNIHSKDGALINTIIKALAFKK